MQIELEKLPDAPMQKIPSLTKLLSQSHATLKVDLETFTNVKCSKK